MTSSLAKTGFLDLPSEIRNWIYDLSGCLRVVQCENCKKHATEDVTTLDYERTCSGNPRIQWPIRYPRHFACRFSRTDHSIDLSRYHGDYAVTHEFINRKTQVLAVPQPYECRSPEQPALTRVCRLMRRDTLAWFYGANKFVLSARVVPVDGIAHIAINDLRWLEAIGVGNASSIRAMQIKLSEKSRTALLVDNIKDSLREKGIDLDGIKVKLSVLTGASWSYGFPRTSVRSAFR